MNLPRLGGAMSVERVYTVCDKLDWGDGPWQNECDKVQWTDATTGFPCLAVRNLRSGNWCGYVGVSEGHPYFEKHYDDPPVDVHGGLTFSEFCDDEGCEETSICHIPEPGEPDHIWWFGFDCAHAGDYLPAMAAALYAIDPKSEWSMSWETYRTLDYVRVECTNLAKQLSQVR
jgi:hypothetical protein